MKRFLMVVVVLAIGAAPWILARQTNVHYSLLQAPIAGLDPVNAADTNTQLILNNAFDGLVGWSFDRGIYPQVAESWTFSDDRLTFRFKIRSNALFQDGTTVTPADVVASLQHLLKTPSYFQDHYRVIGDITAKDDVVEVRLTEPYSDLLLLLSGVGAKIVKRQHGLITGTGPFLPQINKNGVVLKRFSPYWGPTPPTQEIHFDLLSEEEGFARARREEIDDLSLIAMSGTEFPAGHGIWLVQPMWATWTIGMDQRVPPFNRPDVRKEMVARLSSKSFIKEIYPDQEEAFGLIPLGIRGFMEPVKTAPGATPTVDHPTTRVEILMPSFLIKGSLIQNWVNKAFEKSWLKPQVVPTPFEWMIANYAQAKMGAYLLSINAEFPDPSFIIRSLTSDSKSNFLGTKDKRIDAIIAKLQKTDGGEERSRLSRQVNERLIQLDSSVNLMHVRHRVWTRTCVSGLKTNPVSEGYINYREVRNLCH